MSTSHQDDLWRGFPPTLLEFEQRFASEEACQEYWIDVRWDGKVRCKRCGCAKVWPVRGGALYGCAQCGHQTSLIAGTLLAGTRKLIGAKPPLRPSHVWSIRTKLQLEGRTRDLGLFNLAIDSKLRGCDVVAVRVDDVAPSGYTLDRATVRQKKTGRPVRFELTEQTRQAIDEYLRVTGRKPGEFLFAQINNQLAGRDNAMILGPSIWSEGARRFEDYYLKGQTLNG